MNPQLETLLEIQDLKMQRRELETSREMQSEVFHLSVDDALKTLEGKVEEMVESLDPPIRGRYRRLAGRDPRVVAPVIGGTCYGCFVAVPTASARGADPNRDITYCENCGRFLYVVD